MLFDTPAFGDYFVINDQDATDRFPTIGMAQDRKAQCQAVPLDFRLVLNPLPLAAPYHGLTRIDVENLPSDWAIRLEEFLGELAPDLTEPPVIVYLSSIRSYPHLPFWYDLIHTIHKSSAWGVCFDATYRNPKKDDKLRGTEEEVAALCNELWLPFGVEPAHRPTEQRIRPPQPALFSLQMADPQRPRWGFNNRFMVHPAHPDHATAATPSSVVAINNMARVGDEPDKAASLKYLKTWHDRGASACVSVPTWLKHIPASKLRYPPVLEGGA